MGKRLRVQRRGRGSSTFTASTHKRVAKTGYPLPNEVDKNVLIKATVENLLHESGRGVPIAKNRLESGKTFHIVAPEGISVGQEIQIGSSAVLEVGNILPLEKIPAGVLVSNIELNLGDGGKLARASGTYAAIVSHTSTETLIKLPSGKSLSLDNRCLATIGVVSGAGRTDKPFLKSGKRHSWLKAKGRVYPITKGVAMNAVSHPHGGGSHKTQSMRPTTVSRNAPPGQKVGIIAARQTGRGRKKRRRVY